jgi:cytochrome P450
MLRWLRQPYEFLDRCAARYGETFTMRMPGFPPLVVFSGPDAIKDILTGSPDDLVAGEANATHKPFVGEYSMLLLDGAQHKRHRSLLMPPFHGERMQAYGEQILELINDSIDRWPLGEAFPLHTRLQDVALQVILRALFGLDDPRLRKDAETVLLGAIKAGTSPGLFFPFMQRDWGSWSPWAKFLKAKAAVDELMLSIIENRRTQGTAGRVDILSLLVDARDEDGQAMSSEEVRDELLTLLVAGHEATTSSLSWTMRWLLADPALYKRLRDEAVTARDGGRLVPGKVVTLPLLKATIHESLRLEPVTLLVQRITKKPMRIGGADIPANTRVLCSTYLAHRRPQKYPEPSRFHPDRFLNDKASPYEWLPFGGGHRRCIGMAFALYEMKMILASVLARTELRIAPGKTIKPVRRGVILAPSEGLPVVMDTAPVAQPHAGAQGRPAAAPPMVLESRETA